MKYFINSVVFFLFFTGALAQEGPYYIVSMETGSTPTFISEAFCTYADANTAMNHVSEADTAPYEIMSAIELVKIKEDFALLKCKICKSFKKKDNRTQSNNFDMIKATLARKIDKKIYQKQENG